MATRVTEGMLYTKGQESISRNREKMIKGQEQAVTGKAVNRPSDDPVAAMRIVGLKAQGDRAEQVSQNIEVASAVLNMTDSSLGELTDLVSRAKELAIQMGSSSNYTPDARLAVKNEVDQLMARAVQIGNSRIGDRYIFGGYQTEKPPFDLDGNYFGDGGVFEIEVDRGQRVEVNMPGLIPFLGVNEIPPEKQSLREDALRDKEATIESGIRAPAAIAAPKDDKKEVLDASSKSSNNEIFDTNKGMSIFRVFKGFSDGLQSGDISAVHNAIDGLDSVFKQALAARTQIGARQNLVRSSQDSLEMAKVTNAEQASQVEDVDSIKAFSDLAKNEHALNATLETSKRLITPSLLDFLK